MEHEKTRYHAKRCSLPYRQVYIDGTFKEVVYAEVSKQGKGTTFEPSKKRASSTKKRYRPKVAVTSGQQTATKMVGKGVKRKTYAPSPNDEPQNKRPCLTRSTRNRRPVYSLESTTDDDSESEEHPFQTYEKESNNSVNQVLLLLLSLHKVIKKPYIAFL